MKALFERLLEELHGAWRFRWLALALAWLVCVGGWAFVLSLPDSYEASAKVFVDTRTALSRATEGLSIASDIGSQIQRVREALLGGPQLEQVIAKENMLNAGAASRERQDLIADMRERIAINPRGDGLFVISFTDHSRDRSLRVVDRLLNNFVEGSLGGKREGSEQAQHFLVDQIADYERRLSAAEQRLADFKKENVGLMPGAQGDYFSRLQAEMGALTKAQSDLDIALRRREELRRQLSGEQPLATAANGGSRAASAMVTGDNDLASRIRDTQAKLDELLLRFTEKHPDVIALRSTLQELKTRQQTEIEAVQRGDIGAAARMGLGSNPVFQQIQLHLNQADVDIAALRGTVEESRKRVASLNQLVNKAPEVEAEFARLNRDYDVTRTTYQSLVERLDRARLSQQAEETGIVRFEVVDPPSAGFKPVAPKRPQLIVAVLLAGLAAGAGLAYILHQLNPIFGSVRQLSEVTGLPVLGVVSMTWLEKHRAQQRRGVLVYAAAASLLVMMCGAIFVIYPRVIHLMQQWTGST